MADMEPIEPLEGVEFLLSVIGFNDPDQRQRIMEAGLGSYEDFRYLVEKDIRDMAEEFGKRSQNNGRIIFGLGRTKKLTGVMHWIQDNFRTSEVPNHNDFNEGMLAEVLSRAMVRKSDIDLVDTNTKAANPGKFKDERKWPEWEKAFTNYLSVIPGVSGIPLSYIIRENTEPEERDNFTTFNEKMVARAPHTGQYFLADSRRVHNLLTGFLQGEQSESWIRNIVRYQDGRISLHCVVTTQARGILPDELRMRNGSKRITRASVPYPLVNFLIHCRKCSPYSKKRASLCRKERKLTNY